MNDNSVLLHGEIILHSSRSRNETHDACCWRLLVCRSSAETSTFSNAPWSEFIDCRIELIVNNDPINAGSWNQCFALRSHPVGISFGIAIASRFRSRSRLRLSIGRIGMDTLAGRCSSRCIHPEILTCFFHETTEG